MSYRLGATAGLGGRQAPLFVFLDTRAAGPLRVGSHGAARSTRWNTSMNCHAEHLSLSPMATAKKMPCEDNHRYCRRLCLQTPSQMPTHCANISIYAIYAKPIRHFTHRLVFRQGVWHVHDSLFFQKRWKVYALNHFFYVSLQSQTIYFSTREQTVIETYDGFFRPFINSQLHISLTVFR